MTILYFYQYFATSKGSWGTRVYEFAKEWVDKGHRVIVVTSVYSKSDLVATKFIDDQVIDGIELKVLNIAIDNKQSGVKRVWTFLQYSIISSWYALTLKADVIIASSGPITAGFPGLVGKYLRGRKLIFEVRDLWPEGAIELGFIQSKVLKKLCYWFEKKCYNASSAIITLSPGMKKNIEARFGFKNVYSITNSANISLFGTPLDFTPPAVLAEKKYAIYTGNIGMVNNSYWLYKAARIMKEKGREDIIMLLVGEGQQRKELEQKAKEEGLSQFVILPLMPKKDVVAYIQNAMVSLVPLKGTPVLDTSSPNKFFESLAAGVPLIQNTQGWMKDFLDENTVGFTLDPDDPMQLAEKLIELSDKQDMLKQMGSKAKELAVKYFDKNYLAGEMLKIISNVHRPAPTKNVWVINQFAGHVNSGWGERHFFMSRYWRQMGYNVSIISGSFNHMFLNLPNAPEKYNYEEFNDIQFCWVRTPKYDPKSVKRFWSMIVFAWRASRVNVKKIYKPDYIVVSSMPIFPILAGHRLKRKYGAKKLIFEIRDIWPLTLIELGETSRFHPITQFIGWFERFGYKKSDTIVSLLPYAEKHIIAHGGRKEKITYIPNGLDEEVLQSRQLSYDIKAMLPAGKFIIGYTGTHNLGNALEYLIKAAIKLKDKDDIFFVLVGDGYKKDDLVKMTIGLSNIIFIPKIPKQEIQDMISSFTVCFVGRTNSPLFDFGISGNKYFDYMLGGKPILDSNNSPGGPAELAGSGLRVQAESADAIVEGIIKLKEMTAEERDRMGEKGKVFLKNNHSIKSLAEKYAGLFQ